MNEHERLSSLNTRIKEQRFYCCYFVDFTSLKNDRSLKVVNFTEHVVM